ncbi:MAG: hypothetical protein GY861_19130 [bacterium]|nr:hypothetical protein [bacterium]
MSNSTTFISSIPIEDQAPVNKAKVLGIKWLPITDNLLIRGADTDELNNNIITRCLVLHSVAKVFDPLGLFMPLTLKGKILFQNLWKNKYAWDTKVDQSFENEWNLFKANLKIIAETSIPRRLFQFPLKSPFLLCFTDASQQAFGTCIYLWENRIARLIIAKSKLTPSPKTRKTASKETREKKSIISIPHLELLGVLLATKLTSFILKELNCSVAKIYLWSDSKIVLAWINSSKIKICGKNLPLV